MLKGGEEFRKVHCDDGGLESLELPDAVVNVGNSNAKTVVIGRTLYFLVAGGNAEADRQRADAAHADRFGHSCVYLIADIGFSEDVACLIPRGEQEGAFGDTGQTIVGSDVAAGKAHLDGAFKHHVLPDLGCAELVVGVKLNGESSVAAFFKQFLELRNSNALGVLIAELRRDTNLDGF